MGLLRIQAFMTLRGKTPSAEMRLGAPSKGSSERICTHFCRSSSKPSPWRQAVMRAGKGTSPATPKESSEKLPSSSSASDFALSSDSTAMRRWFFFSTAGAGFNLPSTTFFNSSSIRSSGGPNAPYKSNAFPRKTVSLVCSFGSATMLSMHASNLRPFMDAPPTPISWSPIFNRPCLAATLSSPKAATTTPPYGIFASKTIPIGLGSSTTM
mmetsp:Transcript_96590/g.152819  ORF Transcript_96590/g.152819 Transcript_96590/m.152819 type:complete len:211 (-) Transcript_96590:504-1136(-)